ncbi:MAG: hypothetical protein ACHQU0_00980 [Candidatus Paceibacteria bacterium]
MIDSEKQLLIKVIEVAGDNSSMIDAGIRKALQGINERARRTYLWNLLKREATKQINRARKNAEKKAVAIA